MNIKWVCIISGIALFLAILPSWPYGYFILLRWFITASATVVAWGFYKSELAGWALAFGAIAILFNPFFPFFMNKSSWVAIDMVTAILFFIAAYSYKHSNLKRAKK